MNTCPAVKADGETCGKRCRGNPRCGTHMKTLETNGPHTTARHELMYQHRAAVKRLIEQRNVVIDAEANGILRARMTEDLDLDVTTLKNTQRREMAALVREQQDEVRQTGINPDARAEQRREALNRERHERNRLVWEERIAIQRAANARALNQVNQIVGGAVAVQQGELRQFANDGQNVHTTVAVQRTKEMVQKLLSISVPEEYRWNMTECSKTPGDIVMCCKLTPKGGWQMMAKYCQDESIYDLGQGIYGKVLDGVWQYILKSADKEDLCKILKQEMEDNIGMCAQGNLTRLCNILSGYMEGIGPQESPAEVLGRKLPLLMEIENDEDRLIAAYNLFMELNVPENEWLDWAQPLVEATIKLDATAAGRVVGIKIA